MRIVRDEKGRYAFGSARHDLPLLSRYEIDGNGCWIWRGSMDTAGYGRARFQGRYQQAHRIFYQVLVGQIPEGKEIDHLCRVRACVNPEHLEAVTSERYGVGASALRWIAERRSLKDVD